MFTKEFYMTSRDGLSDLLAQAMDDCLNDEQYTNVFKRYASTEETASPVKEVNPVESALNQLVEASKRLDELGLNKSSELVLKAVEALVTEAEVSSLAPKDDKDDEEEDDRVSSSSKDDKDDEKSKE